MSEVVQSYILNYLRDGTAVGIVSFDDAPYLHSGMLALTGSHIRKALASRVPTTTGGGTGIGAGLQLCQQVSNRPLFLNERLFLS